MTITLATAAINTARDRHYVLNPVTGLYERALLLEGSRTNAWTYSDGLTNAAWGKAASSLTPNAVTGPDGVTLAGKLVENAAAGTSHYLNRASAAYTANVTQSFSFFVKAAERSHLRFYLGDGADRFGVDVDLTAGTVAPYTASVGQVDRTSITPFGNGWYRVTVSGKANATAVGGGTVFAIGQSAGTFTYTGDGTSGLYLTGLEHAVDAPFASSYIPTAAATVTRAADSLSLPFTHAPQAMTVYTKFVERGTAWAGLSLMVWHIGSTSQQRLQVFSGSAGGSYRLQLVSEASQTLGTTAASLAAPAIGDLVELLATVNADGVLTLSQTINGGAPQTTVPTTPATLPASWGTEFLNIGSRSGNQNVGFNAFLAVKVAKGLKSLAQMRLLPPVS